MNVNIPAGMAKGLPWNLAEDATRFPAGSTTTT
jgi:hypothetical protein